MCLILMLPIIYYAKLIVYVAVIWARDNAIVNWLCARNDLGLADGNSPAHEDVDFIDGKDRLSSKGKKIELWGIAKNPGKIISSNFMTKLLNK